MKNISKSLFVGILLATIGMVMGNGETMKDSGNSINATHTYEHVPVQAKKHDINHHNGKKLNRKHRKC
ncbi:hypothetical protein BB559_001918 [Furculomyces boomerangus]|uniref:Uncharacterized protein n=1 Tax=Furculomyces boomerangus TaxID=61424 RepID=A0A2T9YZJ7_9FUNG|nr:hypothetical protein BB559_001918 [Furculomyces boomerangus]